MQITLEFDDATIDAIQAKSRALGFGTPEDYLVHLVKKNIECDKTDKEEIARKLEELGYL